MDFFGAIKQTKETTTTSRPAPVGVSPVPPPSVAQASAGVHVIASASPKRDDSSDDDADDRNEVTVGVDLNPDGSTVVPSAPFIGLPGDPMRPKYAKEKLLGNGAYGEAWLCRNTETNKYSVVKCMSLPSMSRKERAYAESEVQCLAAISHPNIVKFFDSFSDGQTLYIAMEYANGGDLRKHIKARSGKKDYLHESEALFIFIQVVLAINYIHSKNMLHRDIKSANVLISSNGLVKLADFGFSQQYEDTVSNAVAKTFCGTPYYLAPELWKNRRYSNKAEVWSLGVFLYELLALQRPFTAPSLKGLMDEVLLGKYPPLPARYSAEASELVGMLLQPNTALRPTAFDIFRIPYVALLTRTLIKLVSENKEIEEEQKAVWVAHTEGVLARAERFPPFTGKPEMSFSVSSAGGTGDNSLAVHAGAPSDQGMITSADISSQMSVKTPQQVQQHQQQQFSAFQGAAPASPQSSGGDGGGGGSNPSVAAVAGSGDVMQAMREAGVVDGSVTFEGRVKKLSAYAKQKWSERFLRLGNGVLELEEPGKGARKLAVESVASVTSITPAAAKRRHVFAIHTVDARCTWLQAPSEFEKDQWIEKLQRAIGVM